LKRFYFHEDPFEELENDIDMEELERISDDEKMESREDILKERNKKRS
jgi:hypothetical protein